MEKGKTDVKCQKLTRRKGIMEGAGWGGRGGGTFKRLGWPWSVWTSGFTRPKELDGGYEPKTGVQRGKHRGNFCLGFNPKEQQRFKATWGQERGAIGVTIDGNRGTKDR